jgi:hypothetical protein
MVDRLPDSALGSVAVLILPIPEKEKREISRRQRTGIPAKNGLLTGFDFEEVVGVWASGGRVLCGACRLVKVVSY